MAGNPVPVGCRIDGPHRLMQRLPASPDQLLPEEFLVICLLEKTGIRPS
jgi:hypothetical protein